MVVPFQLTYSSRIIVVRFMCLVEGDVRGRQVEPYFVHPKLTVQRKLYAPVGPVVRLHSARRSRYRPYTRAWSGVRGWNGGVRLVRRARSSRRTVYSRLSSGP